MFFILQHIIIDFFLSLTIHLKVALPACGTVSLLSPVGMEAVSVRQ